MNKLRACAAAAAVAGVLLVPGAVAFAQNAAPPAAPAPAAPRDPQTLAMAHEYARVAEITATLSRRLLAMSEQVVSRVRQMNPNVPDAVFKAFSQALFDEFLLKRTGEIEATVANVLADTFTKDELKAMRDFYGSPVGRSITQKQAKFIASMPEAERAWLNQALPEAVKAAAARVKASGTELRF